MKRRSLYVCLSLLLILFSNAWVLAQAVNMPDSVTIVGTIPKRSFLTLLIMDSVITAVGMARDVPLQTVFKGIATDLATLKIETIKPLITA